MALGDRLVLPARWQFAARFVREVPAMGPCPLPACGFGAATLSIVTDLVAISRSSRYDAVRQSISDLAAVGAPTRRLVLPARIIDDLQEGTMAYSFAAWIATLAAVLWRQPAHEIRSLA